MPNTREKLIELLAEHCSFKEKKCVGCNPGKYYQPECKTNLFGKIADNLIANGVTIQKWIPVTEPPKEKGVYLISVTHWLDGKPVTREAKWNGVDWLSCYRKEEITPRVTHWMPMPLPEPPKGD